MSKIVEAQAEYMDIECFIEALLMSLNPWKRRNFQENEIEVHLDSDQEAVAERLREKHPNLKVNTNGPSKVKLYNGRDSKYSGNVVVRKQTVGSMDDLGWFIDKNGDSKVLLSDYDDRRGLCDKAWQTTLNQEYGVGVAKKTCRRHGWKFKEERTKNGEVHLHVRGL
jgi:hypothetical protein